MKKPTKRTAKITDAEKAVYTAFDIHRRAAMLAALWIAFDPFGAVVYILRDFEDDAHNLREMVKDTNEIWDSAESLYRPIAAIKEGKDNYETFKNHIKGIEGAIRRLLRNPWIADKNVTQATAESLVKNLRSDIRELRSQM